MKGFPDHLGSLAFGFTELTAMHELVVHIISHAELLIKGILPLWGHLAARPSAW